MKENKYLIEKSMDLIRK
jgi:hypothetical protein